MKKQGDNTMKISWKTCFRVGVTLLALFLIISYRTQISAYALLLLSAAAPLLIGAVIAYPVNILMSFYERHYFPKSRKTVVLKSKRVASLILSYLTLVLIVVLVFALVIPQFVSCIGIIIDAIPEFIPKVITKLEEFNIPTADIVAKLKDINWQSKIEQVLETASSGVGDAMKTVIGTVSSVFSGIVTTLIAVIFSVYILLQKDNISRQIKKIFKRYVKDEITAKINHVLDVMDDCFHKYIIGQCTEAVILGALCTLGMLILRLPYATMVGPLIALTALIPVAGAYIGAFVGAFMILTVSPTKAVIFLIFLVILQQFEGNIIYPKVVGSSIKLPAIWVLAAVTVGGGILGIMGMLIGVPLAATAYRLIKEDVNKADRFQVSGVRGQGVPNSGLAFLN